MKKSAWIIFAITIMKAFSQEHLSNQEYLSNESKNQESKNQIVNKEPDWSVDNEIKTKANNPTFESSDESIGDLNTKNINNNLSIGYLAIFSFSNFELLNINSSNLGYEYLHGFDKLQLRVYAKGNFGDTSFSVVGLQNNIRSNILSGIIGTEISLPIKSKQISYFIIGVNGGYSKISNKYNFRNRSNFLSQQYLSVDFPYKWFVFRPFIKLSFYSASTETIRNGMGLYLDLGLKTFATFKQRNAYIDIAIRRDIIRGNSNETIVLADLQSLSMQGVATSIDIKGGTQVISAKYIKMQGDVGITYNWDYYNIGIYAMLNLILSI